MQVCVRRVFKPGESRSGAPALCGAGQDVRVCSSLGAFNFMTSEPWLAELRHQLWPSDVSRFSVTGLRKNANEQPKQCVNQQAFVFFFFPGKERC